MKTAAKPATAKLTFALESGKKLRFQIHDQNTVPPDQCVYAVLRTRILDNPMRESYGAKDTKFCIIYIGETGNLVQRIEQHSAESWFLENGATHICFYEEPDREIRSVIRSQLVRHYAPDCNHPLDAQTDQV